MSTSRARAGFLYGHLPYNRVGRGPRTVVVFQGLTFENKPMTRLAASGLTSLYPFPAAGYTTYVVGRKPGLPSGYALMDMANDYAAMIEAEFNAPVDVIGTSTGGSIALHFAADHPGLVRKLVIHSSAYTLAPEARQLQLDVARLAEKGRWREANATTLRQIVSAARLSGPVVWLVAALLSLRPPKDPADLIVTVAAEDTFNFRDRLREISAPTLVAGGLNDPFYTEQLFRETAAGIPNAKLALYPNMGHPARGKRFARDILTFLRTP